MHWRVIFFLNIPIGVMGLILVYLHLPDYREKTHPLDTVGLILFGSGIALLSYVLEVFGEHTLSTREISGLLVLSVALLAGYWLHAKSLQFPLLQLSLFRIRTFRAAVRGSFFTRLGIGGVPFLMPLLYQVGLGFTPRLLATVGYRWVLISNTVLLGLMLLLFATVGLHTPVWLILLQAFFYGAFTSLQYSSMNTLVYADTTDQQSSAASSIASTGQQMSISFGVAGAGLATMFFVPLYGQSAPVEMIAGIHKALVALGILTIASTIVFSGLERGDGDAVSQQKVFHPGG
jgi:MFS family permease